MGYTCQWHEAPFLVSQKVSSARPMNDAEAVRHMGDRDNVRYRDKCIFEVQNDRIDCCSFSLVTFPSNILDLISALQLGIAAPAHHGRQILNYLEQHQQHLLKPSQEPGTDVHNPRLDHNTQYSPRQYFVTSSARELRKGCTFAAFPLNGTLRASCASV